MNLKLGFYAHGPSWRELSADKVAQDAARESRCNGYANGCTCPACEKRTEDFVVGFQASPWVKKEMIRLAGEGCVYAGVTREGFDCMEYPERGEILVETAEQTAALRLSEYAQRLGIPCDRRAAKDILAQNTHFIEARRAVKQMGEAAKKARRSGATPPPRRLTPSKAALPPSRREA